MNKVILMGRLVDDVRFTETGKDKLGISQFTLAVDRNDKEHNADFIRCVAFGQRAEFIADYITKGQRVLVEGRWQTGHYTSKDGNTVYVNECHVSNIEFADSKKSDDKDNSRSNRRR